MKHSFPATAEQDWRMWLLNRELVASAADMSAAIGPG